MAINVLVNVREMGDEVVVTEETEGPVDKSKEKKDARNDLSFYNEEDVRMCSSNLEDFYLSS